MLGIDFDDLEFGFKEEDKTSLKKHNEEILAKLVESCTNGMFATMAEAVASLANPTVKSVRPFRQYEGRLSKHAPSDLTRSSSGAELIPISSTSSTSVSRNFPNFASGLGDFVKYPESALYIDVQRYSRTKKAAAPSASAFVLAAAKSNGEGSAQSSNTLEDTEMTDAPALSAVKISRDYKVNDASGAGGFINIEREDLAKGYYYGSTAVPFGQDEKDVTEFISPQGFSIIGFVPSDKVQLAFAISTIRLTHL